MEQSHASKEGEPDGPSLGNKSSVAASQTRCAAARSARARGVAVLAGCTRLAQEERAACEKHRVPGCLKGCLHPGCKLGRKGEAAQTFHRGPAQHDGCVLHGTWVCSPPWGKNEGSQIKQKPHHTSLPMSDQRGEMTAV